MIRTCLITIFVFGILTFSVSGAEKYTDPDSPQLKAAAAQALKSAKILPLSGKVLDIKGITLGVTGTTRGVSGIIQELGGKITDREVRIELSADVLFDFDKAELRPAGIDTLRKVSQVIKGYGKAPVTIEGHTDAVGADDYNLKLSERRAQSVKMWMQKEGGIEATRISIKGLGETKPVAPNTKPDGKDNPEGRQKNRRVEITIKTK